jgi:cytochrome P450
VPNYLIMPRGTDQSTVDLTDLDMWARAVPYAEFGRLRREAPVAWSADEGPGFWSVSRYADIVAASRDVATFSSSRGVSFEDPTDEDMAARRTIIDTDPPEHTKLRKVVASTFSQRAVAVYEHFITGLTEQLEIWAEAWNGSPVSHSGKHYSFGPIWVEPQPARPGGPDLWFGGSSLHPG